MADTMRGSWPKENCNDCGESGVVIIKHWGPLVPVDKIGYFCIFCWNARGLDYKEGEKPKPLGFKPPIEEIPGRKMKVTTKSGSIYLFDKPKYRQNGGDVRRVVANNKKLSFSYCRIKHLRKGRPLYLMTFNDDKKDIGVWATTSVLSIEENT